MGEVIRVTGAWTGIVVDWLDARKLRAQALRAALARWAPDDAVPVERWRAVLAEAIALCPQQPAVALEIGAGVRARHVGVLGYLVLASNDFAEALQAYQRYERLFYGANLAEASIARQHVELRWAKDEGTFGAQHDSVAIAALVTFMRMQVDGPLSPCQVSFTFPRPRGPGVAAAYRDFFGCPVRFGDSHTRVRIPLAHLSTPMSRSDDALRALLEGQAQALLRALPDSDAFDQALQSLILKRLPQGGAHIAAAARDLHVSVRTLQRRLGVRGLTWQGMLDRTREELAAQYLADESLALSDIALLLGFSEQSAFNRAFRRWTGKSPGQLRADRHGRRGPSGGVLR